MGGVGWDKMWTGAVCVCARKMLHKVRGSAKYDTDQSPHLSPPLLKINGQPLSTT